MSSLISSSATELARKIRRRECSAVEVLEAHLARIRARNPAVNAIVTLNADRAYARAQAADRALNEGELWGPLHGLPVTVKDQFASADLRTTYGLRPYADFVPEEDAPLVSRLRHAGALLLGKTNLPRAAYDWQCVHPTLGRTNNPWDLSRTPGGSSGGSAAALAAGFSPLELGADAGGSIRVPSHFCGTAGLRPTEHALPLDGITPPDRVRTVRHIAVAGPMARTVEDLQLAWSVLHSSEEVSSPAGSEPVAPEELRIAVTPELGGVPVDTETQRVLREATTTWKQAGCTVQRCAPPFDVSSALDVWGDIQGFELTASLPAPLRRAPLKHLFWQGAVRSKFGFLATRLARGARLDGHGYFDALTRKEELTRTLDSFLADWDCWVTPVAARPAFPHCRTGTSLSIEGVSVPYALPFAFYTCATAAPGHPILTIPAGRSSEGLPIGLQLHRRPGTERSLLNLGRTLSSLLETENRLAPLDTRTPSSSPSQGSS